MIKFNLSELQGIDTNNLGNSIFLNKLKSIGISISYDDMEGTQITSTLYGEEVTKEKFMDIYNICFGSN